jgi:hypothetical protein
MMCEVQGCTADVRVTDMGVVCGSGHAYVPREPPTARPPGPGPLPTPVETKMRMPFGKHRGELVEDIPTAYVEWLLGNLELRPDLQRELEAQLELRGGRGVIRR